MLVKELMNHKVVSVSASETISRALAKMKQNKVHQLPVLNGELKGMLVLRKIVTKDIDPNTTKADSFVLPAATLSPDMDIIEAAEKLLSSGFRALPVSDSNKLVGILAETDLMQVIDKFNLNYSLAEIMCECDYVSVNDDIGKVKKIMAYKNVSRVPVVNNGKIVGTIGTLDLIDIMLRNEPMKGGDIREKGTKVLISVDKTPVAGVMKEPVVINKDSTIEDAAKLLFLSEEIFVEDDGRFFVITPKDLVEIIAKGEKEGIYVQIANLGEIDALTNAKIDKKITEFVQKMARMIKNLQSFVIHVEKDKKQGEKIRYLIRTRFLTSLGLFVSRSEGWDFVTVFQDAVDNLEREILKKHGKIVEHWRGKRSKEMMRE